ncbi:hypothetical protein, partial [Burkholderia cepacia]|uniref:hypothetical protein n=1 Tax=Burkholderia cepacia TaxID=292 RepID=UPI001ABAA03E
CIPCSKIEQGIQSRGSKFDENYSPRWVSSAWTSTNLHRERHVQHIRTMKEGDNMQSKAKNTIRVAVALGLAFALCGAADAQEIPPACQQLIRTMEACTTDLANWGDYNDPAGAVKVRETMRTNVAQIKASIQRAIKEKGTIAVAQHCASHDVKSKIVGNFGGMVTPVLMSGGDASSCQSALASMQ